MTDWLTFPVAFSGPCALCRIRRADHDDDEMGHEWRDIVPQPMTEQQSTVRTRTYMRELRGEYTAPLPLPAERRRIREAAGWTQEQVADDLREKGYLRVTRQYAWSFEKPTGWRDGVRLPGREPTGELRAEYSTLLRKLVLLGP